MAITDIRIGQMIRHIDGDEELVSGDVTFGLSSLSGRPGGPYITVRLSVLAEEHTVRDVERALLTEAVRLLGQITAADPSEVQAFLDA